MKIILKFIFRNMLAKKLRTILILFSVTLSTALLFSTLSISGTVEKIMSNQLKKYYGSAEIQIARNQQSLESPFFSMITINEVNQYVDYIIPSVAGYATYPDNLDYGIYLSGYTLQNIESMYDVTFSQSPNGVFVDHEAIIGVGEAKALGLKIGDSFDLNINGDVHTFTVAGIGNASGIFNFDGKTLSIMIPQETLASFYGASGEVNRVYVKVNETSSVSQVMKILSDSYGEDFVVKTTVTEAEINQSTATLTTAFSFMLLLVIFISILIIYTSFKVITLERLPMVGTFRSIGATKKMTDIILLGESVFYGLIGGIMGSVLGIGILYMMAKNMAYNPYTGVTSDIIMVYGPTHFILSIVFALILSIISALVPIIRISKIPVRNIVVNNIRNVTKKSKKKAIIGVVFLIIPLLSTFIKSPNISVGAVYSILITISVILLVPYVTSLFIVMFEKGIHVLFGNEGTLAVKNLRENKNIINNILLLTIGIASILMINTMTNSVYEMNLKVYKLANFSIYSQLPKIDETQINRFTEIPGLTRDDIYGIYTLNDVKIEEKNDYVSYLWGIDAKKYFTFWDLDIMGDEEAVINQLSEGRYAITSTIIQSKYGLSVGDHITLKLPNGDFSYEIIGTTNTLLNNGNFIYIDENYIKQDAGIHYMSDIMIKTDHPNEVVQQIKDKFGSEGLLIVTMDKQQEDNIAANEQVFSLLQGFSIVAMLISIFGVFNNLMVSFISRKRSLALYRSIGMSKRQLIKMLFVESLSSGVIAGVTGVLTGILFIEIDKMVMNALLLPIPIIYSIGLFVTAFISGIFISVVSSVIPALRSSKQSIIESIKYE